MSRQPAKIPKQIRAKSTGGKSKTKVSSNKPNVAKPRPPRSGPPVKIVRTIKDIHAYLREARKRSRTVAVIPTMGYLHEGHLSLVEQARKLAHLVVVTIFVNPTQFGPQEDLDRYPRDLSGDRRKLTQAGASVVFVPDEREMYPEGFQTYVDVTEVTRDYTGASRPGHFRGVTTVVAKLFHIIEPDVAIFGEKDYQQLVAIQRMVKDLNLRVKVLGLPTVREEDGLAMSSRNAYLSPSQRLQASAIYRGLQKAKRELDAGERDAAELVASILDILREERELDVDYVTVCDLDTLERLHEVEKSAIAMVAARIGDTYLIDNLRLDVKRRR